MLKSGEPFFMLVDLIHMHTIDMCMYTFIYIYVYIIKTSCCLYGRYTYSSTVQYNDPHNVV